VTKAQRLPAALGRLDPGARLVLLEDMALEAPEEVAAFAAAVCALLENPGQRQRLGQRGPAYVREWSAEAMTLRLAGLYEGGTGRPQRNRPSLVGRGEGVRTERHRPWRRYAPRC
jgi:hypothetical protein